MRELIEKIDFNKYIPIHRNILPEDIKLKNKLKK